MFLKNSYCELTDEQLKRIEEELLEDVCTLACQKLTERTRDQLVSSINELFVLLPTQFGRKEAGGYLHEVLEEYPEWKRQIGTLWIEQALLYEDLREIRDHLEDVENVEAAQSWVSLKIREWGESYRRHVRQEEHFKQAAHQHAHA